MQLPLRPRLPIRTPRLALRHLTLGDVDDLVAYRSLPEVCRYVPFEPMDAAAVAERIERVYGRTEIDEDGAGLILAVELATEARVIGDVMLRLDSLEHRRGELGYVLHPGYGGRGYATEAAHAILHLAFDEFGFHCVVARLDAENADSAALAVRLSMRCEAHFVEHEWFKGRWSDVLDYAILDREWRVLHNGAADATRWCPLAGSAGAPA